MKSIVEVVRYIWKHKPIFFLILSAFTLTLIRVFPDGQYGCVNNTCGMIIGGNYRDGVWFMAVAASAFKTIPFRMPIFSEATLQGYHYLPAFFMHLITQLGIPITFVNYKLFPLIYMLGITYLLIRFGRKIKDHPVFVFFFLLFFLLGIPLTTITALIHGEPINNGLLINTFQSTKIFDSIPTAFSFLLLLAALLILKAKKRSLKKRFALGIIFFAVFGTKFYTAVVLTGIIFLYELFSLIKQNQTKKQFFLSIFWYLISIACAILVFYNPFSSAKNGSIFIFTPFATVHHLIESPSLFTSNNLVLARYYLYTHGFSPRLLLIELLSVALYLLFYFGFRVLGFFYIIRAIFTKKLTSLDASIIISIICSIIFSVLFIQKGDWFNPIQFAVIASYLLSLYAALFMLDLWNLKSRIPLILTILMLVFVLAPSNLINLGYINSVGREVIPTEEMKGLDLLQSKPDGVIFVPNLGADSPYVSVFTGKQTFVNFTNVLENTGIQFQDRLRLVSNPQNIRVENLLIQYAFIPKRFDKSNEFIRAFSKSQKYKLILNNKGVAVYEKKEM